MVIRRRLRMRRIRCLCGDDLVGNEGRSDYGIHVDDGVAHGRWNCIEGRLGYAMAMHLSCLEDEICW